MHSLAKIFLQYAIAMAVAQMAVAQPGANDDLLTSPDLALMPSAIASSKPRTFGPFRSTLTTIIMLYTLPI